MEICRIGGTLAAVLTLVMFETCLRPTKGNAVTQTFEFPSTDRGWRPKLGDTAIPSDRYREKQHWRGGRHDQSLLQTMSLDGASVRKAPATTTTGQAFAQLELHTRDCKMAACGRAHRIVCLPNKENQYEPFVQVSLHHSALVLALSDFDHVADHVLVAVGPVEPWTLVFGSLPLAQVLENVHFGSRLPSTNAVLECLLCQLAVGRPTF